MDEFERRIIALEQEVRALKTAHRRGLAVVEFPVVNDLAPMSSTYGWGLSLTGSNSRIFPFLAQIAVSDQNISGISNRPVVIDPDKNNIQVFYWFNQQNPHVRVKIVATDSVKSETSLITTLEVNNE